MSKLLSEVASEAMLGVGVKSLDFNLKQFENNRTQVVSNLWEDMHAVADGARIPADFCLDMWGDDARKSAEILRESGNSFQAASLDSIADFLKRLAHA